jgi:hypothetical protein
LSYTPPEADTANLIKVRRRDVMHYTGRQCKGSKVVLYGKWQPKIIIYPRFLPRIALRGNFDEDQSVSALLSAI